jgi:glycogen operon protein
MLATTKHLARVRKDHPALRPTKFGVFGERIPSASQVDWYNTQGETMEQEDWEDPHNRTLQYVAASTPENEPFNRILMIIHGTEQPTSVVVPKHFGVQFYEPLWFSPHHTPREVPGVLRPGETFKLTGTSILLFNAAN